MGAVRCWYRWWLFRPTVLVAKLVERHVQNPCYFARVRLQVERRDARNHAMHMDLRGAFSRLELAERRDAVFGCTDLLKALSSCRLEWRFGARVHAAWEGYLAGVGLGAFGAQHEQYVVLALVFDQGAQHRGAAQIGWQPVARIRQDALQVVIEVWQGMRKLGYT